MKRYNRPPIGNHIAWILCLVFFICSNTLGWADEQYDVAVMVLARGPAASLVAVSYASRVDHTELRQGLMGLAEKTGARLSDIDIVDERKNRSSAELATSVQFTAVGLIKWDSRSLPIGPVLRSLPEWERMRIVFIMGEGFRLIGPRSAAADGFKVNLVNPLQPYEYDVERMNGEVKPAIEGEAREQRVASLLPPILIGLPAGALVGWLLSDMNKGSRARKGAKPRIRQKTD